MAHQGQAVLERVRRGKGPASAAVVLCLALAGCGAGESLDGVFGAQDAGVAGTSAGVSNTTGNLMVGTGPNRVEYQCPPVTVRTGAAAWQVTEKEGLRYQGNIGQLARECSINGPSMMVKVGIGGRLLLGDKGTPGQFKAPIRIAVVEEGPTPKIIATKFFVVPVDIPQGQNSASFTVVEDQISFPLLKPNEMDRYVIYVGFDPQGAPKETTRSSRPSSASSRPKPSSSSSSSSSRPTASAPKPASSSSTPKPASSSSGKTSDPGAPQGDVFGPPPSGNTSSGGFSAPPPSGTFAPPPN